MRYFWTFFWTFLLAQMLTYVVSAMNGTSFNFEIGTILAVLMTILIFSLSAILPEGPNEKEGVH